MSDEIKTGTVKFFNASKGFGFIKVGENEKDIFVHFSNIKGDGYKTLEEGDAVRFRVIDGPKGLQAEDVERVS